jgi:hypothetical protein
LPKKEERMINVHEGLERMLEAVRKGTYQDFLEDHLVH